MVMLCDRFVTHRLVPIDTLSASTAVTNSQITMYLCYRCTLSTTRHVAVVTLGISQLIHTHTHTHTLNYHRQKFQVEMRCVNFVNVTDC